MKLQGLLYTSRLIFIHRWGQVYLNLFMKR